MYIYTHTTGVILFMILASKCLSLASFVTAA